MKKLLSLEELLAGLAESCCELGKASLMLRRVFDGTNPCMLDEQDAIDQLEDRIAGVFLYLDQIDYSLARVNELVARKREAWQARLEES